MDASGDIYMIPEEFLQTPEAKEDTARLDGYLRARAEADAPSREARRKAARKAAKKARKHGRQR